jgi:hypothetical protein
MQGVISVFLYLLRLALCPKIWSFWRKFRGLLRRMYIVLLKGEIFYWYLLGQFDLWCHLVLGFLYWFFCLDDLFIGYRRVLTSPTTIMFGSISRFKSFNVCLMKLGTLTLGTYRLIIVTSFFFFFLYVMWTLYWMGIFSAWQRQDTLMNIKYWRIIVKLKCQNQVTGEWIEVTAKQIVIFFWFSFY